MPMPRHEFAACTKLCCKDAVRTTPTAASSGYIVCPDCHRALSHNLDETGNFRWHAHPMYRECQAVADGEQ
jgi:hypothetical protein